MKSGAFLPCRKNTANKTQDKTRHNKRPTTPTEQPEHAYSSPLDGAGSRPTDYLTNILFVSSTNPTIGGGFVDMLGAKLVLLLVIKKTEPST